MPVVSFAIQKGGTGKTTSTVMVSATLAREGNKVLLMDLDPQANATQCLTENHDFDFTVADLLLGKVKDSDKVIYEQRSIPNLFYIPSSMELLMLEYKGQLTGIAPDVVKHFIKPLLNSFDYIICDCPPSLNHYMKNALWASDYLIIPVEPEPLSFDGTKQLIGEILPEIQQSNPKLKLGGVLIKHRSNALRKWLPEQIRGRLDTIRNGIRFQNEIRVDQELAKMAVKHSPACVYSSKSAGVEDYYVVTQEFIKRTKS